MLDLASDPVNSLSGWSRALSCSPGSGALLFEVLGSDYILSDWAYR
jgi:hypothetical protein